MKQISILLLLIMTVGCSKRADVADTTVISDLTKVVYQRNPSVPTSTKIFGDHLLLAEDITFGTRTLEALAKVPEWNTAVARFGPLTKGQRATYDHSPVTVTTIPVSKGQMVMVYNHNGNYKVMVMVVQETAGITTYRTTTVDNKPYVAVSVSGSGQIKGVQVGSDTPVKKDSQPMYMYDDGGGGKTCPEKHPTDFYKCFYCASQECLQDALCGLVCGFQPHLCVAGFIMACATWS